MDCIWTVNVLIKALSSSNPGNPEDAWQKELDCQTLALHHLVQDHECVAILAPHPSSVHQRGVIRAVFTTVSLWPLSW